MNELATQTSEEIVQTFREQVNNRLLEIVGQYSTPDSLYSPMQYVLESGGKRIRPVLLMLVNHAYGGDRNQGLNTGAALEILHNFTLVHDDIMDGDDQRRGRLTVHKKWDISTAILSGDGLLALAYKVLLEIKHPALNQLLSTFTEGVIDVCEGQAFDKAFENRSDVTLDEYMMMIGKKTARLIAMCCSMGGLLAQVAEPERKKLKRFGFLIGEAFQVQDDLLELTSTAEIMGKSLGSDLAEQKKTFVLLKALELADSSQHIRLQQLMESYASESFDRLKDLITETGVISHTEQFIIHKINEALGILSDLNADTTHLQFITEQLSRRKA